ncbi:protein Flattop [Symphorus nematophorus]
MSSSYSSQYDSAFEPRRLQNWCGSKHHQRPGARQGHTAFVANDRGHLLPGVKKAGSAWPDFKGTWDLPARIPPHSINPSGRSAEGLSRLRSWGLDPRHTGTSPPHRGSRDTHRLQDVGEQTDVDVQQEGGAPSSAASQNLSVAGGERPASVNLDSQSAVVGSVGQPAEEKQALQATGKDRPLSQRSAAEEEPALRPAAASAAAAAGGEAASSRLSTGRGRAASNVAERAASQRESSSSKQRHRDAQTDQ